MKSKHSHRSFVRSDVLKNQGYPQEIIDRMVGPQRPSTKLQYATKVKEFQKWATLNKVSHTRPRSKDIAMFLHHKSKTQRPGSVANYRTALNNYYSPDVVSNNGKQNISRLIRSYYVDNPKSQQTVMSWDINKVLNSLKKSPYEPAEESSLEDLTFKAIFLISFACGKRRAEIHAMSKEVYWSNERINGSEVANIPVVLGFMTKNVKDNASAESLSPITFPSLDGYLGPDLSATSDLLLCPVRILKLYLKATEPMRGDRQRLFVSPFSSTVVGTNTISSWIVRAIDFAYNGPRRSHRSVQNETYCTAHQVRSVSASWSLRGCASMHSILKACHWKSQSTFTSYYLKDCWTSNDRTKYTLGPLVAAGQIIKPQ